MAKKTKFEIKKLFDKKFWNDFGMETYSEYKKHTFNKSNPKMSDGNPFPRNYTPKYSKAKRSGKLRRQDSSYRNSYAPVLTGDLLRDFQGFNLISGGFRFGTPTQGGKVKNLAKLGRVIASESKPIPDKVAKYIMSQANKYVKKRLGKIKGKKININIG